MPGDTQGAKRTHVPRPEPVKGYDKVPRERRQYINVIFDVVVLTVGVHTHCVPCTIASDPVLKNISSCAHYNIVSYRVRSVVRHTFDN